MMQRLRSRHLYRARTRAVLPSHRIPTRRQACSLCRCPMAQYSSLRSPMQKGSRLSDHREGLLRILALANRCRMDDCALILSSTFCQWSRGPCIAAWGMGNCWKYVCRSKANWVLRQPVAYLGDGAVRFHQAPMSGLLRCRELSKRGLAATFSLAYRMAMMATHRLPLRHRLRGRASCAAVRDSTRSPGGWQGRRCHQRGPRVWGQGGMRHVGNDLRSSSAYHHEQRMLLMTGPSASLSQSSRRYLPPAC
ncbi:hypothetical protein PYCCODRAFT_58156 [Trametes coccinea BRFM310]|uniref:Uncharacterized protein n=1 Tax=Trametes coccinea (strain BRFM310) TaxID=1353009 RepID=A0A1Y2IU63_TRAC3|nr:hypothetical protein PYCCODRAFT_58156 [Trametes coccinea BRFM310]